MRTAAHPFLFVGCVELRQTLDMHALDERELMHRVAEVPADSVFFHTFGYFLRHRPFTTAYGNRSEEHTSELQSLAYLVCRLLLEKKKKTLRTIHTAHHLALKPD